MSIISCNVIIIVISIIVDMPLLSTIPATYLVELVTILIDNSTVCKIFNLFTRNIVIFMPRNVLVSSIG